MRTDTTYKVLIFMFVIMFMSCRGSRLEVIKALRKNPEIKKISFVKRLGIDHQFAARVELINGGSLEVLLDSPSAVIYLKEIGPYTGSSLVLNEFNGKRWIYHTYVSSSLLGDIFKDKYFHMNGIIEAYNEILAFYETIYNEPPIPDGDGIDAWGDDEELRQFTGYIVIDMWKGPHKYKIYVRRTDDVSGARLPKEPVTLF
ncbi:MAG: hypothetical protein LBK83_10135 [Treponema sp.]|nr:hypothetical protein [Treponema sp.]